jgi:hypothetical protein
MASFQAIKSDRISASLVEKTGQTKKRDEVNHTNDRELSARLYVVADMR